MLPTTGSVRYPSLSEPIGDTVTRELTQVLDKLKYVLEPRARTEKGGLLKKWDLWGPLILCLCLSMILWSKAAYDQKSSAFSLGFSITWLGVAAATLNASLLGASVSFFQAVCVLGYCLFPMVIAALLCAFVPRGVAFLRLPVVGVAFYFASGASSSFMGSLTSEEKRMLALYPVYLFFVMIGWLIVVM